MLTKYSRVRKIVKVIIATSTDRCCIRHWVAYRRTDRRRDAVTPGSLLLSAAAAAAATATTTNRRCASNSIKNGVDGFELRGRTRKAAEAVRGRAWVGGERLQRERCRVELNYTAPVMRLRLASYQRRDATRRDESQIDLLDTHTLVVPDCRTNSPGRRMFHIHTRGPDLRMGNWAVLHIFHEKNSRVQDECDRLTAVACTSRRRQCLLLGLCGSHPSASVMKPCMRAGAAPARRPAPPRGPAPAPARWDIPTS